MSLQKARIFVRGGEEDGVWLGGSTCPTISPPPGAIDPPSWSLQGWRLPGSRAFSGFCGLTKRIYVRFKKKTAAGRDLLKVPPTYVSCFWLVPQSDLRGLMIGKIALP